MIDFLAIVLRICGAGLILLGLLHVPISKHLNWREDAARMSELNAMVFHVHTFFIVLVLFIMGVPALVDPMAFLEPSRAAKWGCWSLVLFWVLRLVFQWTAYKPAWWKGKRFETSMHWFFSCIWLLLIALFAACAAVQHGWIE